MARRRINTKFLGISLTILIVLAGGALAAKKFLLKENPQQFIADGDAFAKQGLWEPAANNYARAAALLPKDAEIWVRYGTALVRTEDFEKRKLATDAFRQAVQIDPNREAAWLGLMDAAEMQVDIYARQAAKYRSDLATALSIARDAAAKVAKLEANNPDMAKRARALSHLPILNIQHWLSNIPIPETAEDRAQKAEDRLSDEQKVAASIVQLIQLLHDDPTNTRAISMVAIAKLRQAQLALEHEKADDANTLIAEALGVCDDARKAEPKNVEILWAKYGVLQRVVRIDLDRDRQQQYSKQMRETVDAAQTLVDDKVNPNQYLTVKCEWASLLASTDPGRAETVLQDVMQKNPAEITPKIELARILQKYSTRRGDGLAVLDQVPTTPPVGMALGRRQVVESQIYLANQVRTDILIDLYVLEADPTKKKDLADKVQKCLDDMAPGHAEDWQFQKVKGRYELKSGKIRDAIQTLTAADRNMTTAGLRDMDLLMYEADAYRLGQQTSEAIALLEKAMATDSRMNNTPAPHIVLAQLYLNDHQISSAKRHIDWLKVRFPDNPDIIQLQISALDPTLDKDEIAKLYAKLPESGLQESLDKARIAHANGNDGEAERILKSLHDAKPDDLSLTYRLAMFYVSIDRKDDAMQLVTEAQKAKPGDTTLQVLADAIAGKSNAEMGATIRKQIDEIKDPYQKATRLADLARTEGKTDEELQHLQDAEKIQPSAAVLDRLFSVYVALGQFGKAEEYANKLAEKDADQAHGLLYKMRLVLAKGDTQSAIAIGRQLTTDYKEFSESWEALGEALQAARQFDAAIGNYQTALDKQGTNVKAMRNLISCYYQLNKLDEARSAIADARKKFPDDANYRGMAIQHELLYGDPETVLDTLRDDLKKKATDPRAYQTLAAALQRATTVKRIKGDNDTANAHLAEARDVLQQAVKRWPDEMAFTIQLATVCQSVGDVPTAEAALKALAERPRWKNEPAPAMALAALYSDAHKFDQAESTLRALLVNHPDNADVQMRLAQVLMSEQKNEEALKVLETNQTLLPVRKARAELLLTMNRGAQAERETAAAVAAEPANFELSNLLLFVYFSEGKLSEARDMATQSIKASANNLPPYYYRAKVNMQGQNPDLNAAVSDLIYVRDRASDPTEARLALSDCYARRNDFDSAIKEMEAGVHASPTNKRLRLALVDLYSKNDPPRWIDAEQALTEGLGMPQFKDDPDLLRRAAFMYASRGDAQKAVAAIQAAMAQMPDRSPLVRDYLDILLTAKQYPMLLKESDSLVSDPNCPWWVYDYRARAEARSGDTTEAAKDFEVALDKAGAEKTHTAATAVAHDIATDLNPNQAIEMVGRRTQSSTMWKLVAIPLYEKKGDRAASIKAAEGAMASISSLTPAEQDELLGMMGSLYVTSDPPAVDKAVDIYKQILQRHPGDYLSMNNLACILAEQASPPRLPEALDFAQKAYDATQKAGTNDLLVADTLAWVKILSGDVNGGTQMLLQIIDKATFPDAHYHLAVAYLRNSRPENAQAELRSAYDILEKMPPGVASLYGTLRTKLDQTAKEADKMVVDKTQAKAGT